MYYEHKTSSPSHRVVSVIKRNKFIRICFLGPSLVSVVRIREGPYYRGFFLKKIYEDFVGTSEIVSYREVAVLERCPYGEV